MRSGERGLWLHPLFRMGVALAISFPATVMAAALVRWAVFSRVMGLKEALDVTGMILPLGFIPFMLASSVHPRLTRLWQERQVSLQRASILAGVLAGVMAGFMSAALMGRGVVYYPDCGAFFGLIQGLIVGYWRRGAFLSF